MHMEYANITLDAGADMSAHKLLWRNLEQFSVVIHISDFLYLTENFKVILLLNDNLLSIAE